MWLSQATCLATCCEHWGLKEYHPDILKLAVGVPRNLVLEVPETLCRAIWTGLIHRAFLIVCNSFWVFPRNLFRFAEQMTTCSGFPGSNGSSTSSSRKTSSEFSAAPGKICSISHIRFICVYSACLVTRSRLPSSERNGSTLSNHSRFRRIVFQQRSIHIRFTEGLSGGARLGLPKRGFKGSSRSDTYKVFSIKGKNGRYRLCS